MWLGKLTARPEGSKVCPYDTPGSEYLHQKSQQFLNISEVFFGGGDSLGWDAIILMPNIQILKDIL